MQTIIGLIERGKVLLPEFLCYKSQTFLIKMEEEFSLVVNQLLLKFRTIFHQKKASHIYICMCVYIYVYKWNWNKIRSNQSNQMSRIRVKSQNAEQRGHQKLQFSCSYVIFPRPYLGAIRSQICMSEYNCSMDRWSNHSHEIWTKAIFKKDLPCFHQQPT